MTHHGLTPTQRKTMTFIETFDAKHGYAPSFDEMMGALGLKSKSSIERLVIALEERGHISRIPNRARSITVIRRVA